MMKMLMLMYDGNEDIDEDGGDENVDDDGYFVVVVVVVVTDQLLKLKLFIIENLPLSRQNYQRE